MGSSVFGDLPETEKLLNMRKRTKIEEFDEDDEDDDSGEEDGLFNMITETNSEGSSEENYNSDQYDLK